MWFNENMLSKKIQFKWNIFSKKCFTRKIRFLTHIFKIRTVHCAPRCRFRGTPAGNGNGDRRKPIRPEATAAQRERPRGRGRLTAVLLVDDGLIMSKFPRSMRTELRSRVSRAVRAWDPGRQTSSIVRNCLMWHFFLASCETVNNENGVTIAHAFLVLWRRVCSSIRPITLTLISLFTLIENVTATKIVLVTITLWNTIDF